jgi:hypothetical protein
MIQSNLWLRLCHPGSRWLPKCHVHFIVDVLGIMFEERFRRPRITGDHCQIRNNLGERETKSAQQNDGNTHSRAGSNQQTYAAKQSQEPNHPREMDNKRRYQLAMSGVKHARVAIARLVPVRRLPRFILAISSLREGRVTIASSKFPPPGFFCPDFDPTLSAPEGGSLHNVHRGHGSSGVRFLRPTRPPLQVFGVWHRSYI